MATPAAWAVGLLRLGSVPFAVALVWASIAPEAVAPLRQALVALAGAVLAFVGGKLTAEFFGADVPTPVALAVIVTILGGGVGASLAMKGGPSEGGAAASDEPGGQCPPRAPPRGVADRR